jgi:hypothetical protein
MGLWNQNAKGLHIRNIICFLVEYHSAIYITTTITSRTNFSLQWWVGILISEPSNTHRLCVSVETTVLTITVWTGKLKVVQNIKQNIKKVISSILWKKSNSKHRTMEAENKSCIMAQMMSGWLVMMLGTFFPDSFECIIFDYFISHLVCGHLTCHSRKFILVWNNSGL